MHKGLFFLLLLSACSASGSSTVDPSKKYACNEAYICPQGQDCVADCCGGPPCGTTFYEKLPDNTPPPVTLGPAEGCASGMGYEFIAGKAYGCPGIFTGGAAKQCTKGLLGGDYLPCTTSHGIALYSDSLDHFFASAQPMEQAGEGAQCGWGTRDNSLAHYVAGIGGANLNYVAPVGICAGWKWRVQVDATPNTSGWSAKISTPPSEMDMDSLANANPDDGVICCRNII